MAADTVPVVLEPDHFSGGDHLWRTGRIGDPREIGLLQMFRNLVDELNERIQSGRATIANGGTSVAVTLPNAMPDTDYDVVFSGVENPTNTPGAHFVTNIATTGFTLEIENDPGASNYDVAWIARSRTRIHTKG